MSRAYWSIFRAIVTVGSYSLLARAFSVVKEGLVAYRIGISPDLDAFLLALAFPTFLFGAINGALASAFVPAYIHVRAVSGESAAQSMAGQLSWLLCLALIGLALVSAPFLGDLLPLIARQFAPETTALAVSMLFMLMPVLVLNGMAGLCSGYLNANERFALPAIMPVATPLILIGVLIFAWESLGIHALIVGTVAGALFELLVAGAYAAKLGFPMRLITGYWRVIRKNVGPEFIAAAAGTVLIGTTVLVDQSMAAMLEPGSVGTLSYGVRVPGTLAGIGTVALATALLPHLSTFVATRRFGELRRLLAQYAMLTAAVSFPIAVLLMFLSRPIISLLFERGAFDTADTMAVAHVQIAYAMYIPFYSLSVIAGRLVSAMQSNLVLFFGGGLSLLLNVVLNLVLSRYFGVAGIALATSGMYLVSCVYLWYSALHRLRRLDDSSPEQAQDS